MPIINACTLIFQSHDLDLSAISSLIPATISSVEAMLNESSPPSDSARSKTLVRLKGLQTAGHDLILRAKRNPRSALAAAEATYRPNRPAPSAQPKKKQTVGRAANSKAANPVPAKVSLPNIGKRKRSDAGDSGLLQCLVLFHALAFFIRRGCRRRRV